MPAARVGPARAPRNEPDSGRPFRARRGARAAGVGLMEAPRKRPARRTVAPRGRPVEPDGAPHGELPAAPHFPATTAKPRPFAESATKRARTSVSPRFVPRVLDRAAIVFAWEVRTFFLRP